MNINEIVQALQACRKTGQNSYQAKCPAHDDQKASLTVTDAGDKILMYCHAGCTTKAILEKLGLTEKDLFKSTNNQVNSKIVAEYFYTDEKGIPLYKAVRLEPKSFFQMRYYNGNWIQKMNGARYVLYNLPNVIGSNEIYFVEGEKDADNLNKIGLVATTTVGGARGFKKRAMEYVKYLKDKIVYLIPDNDESGLNYSREIYSALQGIAKEVKILNLTNVVKDLKQKGDISDVLQEYGKEKTLNILKDLQSKSYSNDTKIFPISQLSELNEDTFRSILKYLGIKIQYNIITKRVVITGMPEKYALSDLYSILPIYLKNVLRNNGIKINDTKKIEEFILLEISKNNFNPILDMLTLNKWDNIDRYGEICKIFNLSDSLDKTLLIKWLRQTVAMLLNDLNKPFGSEGVLTLQGKQGIGKSRILSLLALNPEWIADGVVLDMNNKDSLIKSTSYWICEFGELEDTLKKEQSSLKAFVTSPVDDIRPPYGKTSIRRARNTSFCATVNSISFLKDDTGSRRFWVIHVDHIDYKKLENLGHNFIIQLWSQVYEEVKSDINCFRLTDEERNLVMKNNLKYTEFLPYEEELLNMIDFDSSDKKIWTSKELISIFPECATAQALGRALNKIENNYPNAIKIKRTSKGVTYLMKIKDEFIQNKK